MHQVVFVLPEHGKFEFHHVRSIRSFAGTKLLGAPYSVHVQGREGCAAGQLADNLEAACGTPPLQCFHAWRVGLRRLLLF